MDTFLKPGRLFLAVAMVMFGIQQLVGASFSIAVLVIRGRSSSPSGLF
jgi:hypothetical protein